MGNTAQFALPYPANTDPLANMAAAIQALANAVDVDLLHHVGAGNRLDNTAVAQPSQPAGLKIITGRVSQAISGGLFNITFPGAGFATGCLYLGCTTTGGTTAAPVVNSGSITKTTAQLFITGSAFATGFSGTATVAYVAIGY